MAIDTSASYATGSVGQCTSVKKETITEAMMTLGREIMRAEELLGVNLPDDQAKNIPVSKIDNLIETVRYLAGKVQRINATLEGL